MVAKAFFVFNAQQVDGWSPPAAPVRARPVERLAIIEQYVANLAIKIVGGGNRAFYRPATDAAHVPTAEQFHSMEARYATIAHEVCGHATGHPSRLNRDRKGRFGSETYAVEELVAELAAPERRRQQSRRP